MMTNEFDSCFNQILINESLRNILSSPRVLIAAAALLGIIHTNYTIPKIRDIQSRVSRSLQQKTPEQVKAIEQKAVNVQNTAQVDALLKRVTAPYKPIQYKHEPVVHKPIAAAKSSQDTKQIQSKSVASAQKPQITPSAANKAEEFYKKAMKNIWNDEIGDAGIEYHKMYKDSKGYNTIGVGHLVTAKELPLYANKTLTDKEVLDLFKQDSAKKLKLTQQLFPQFDTYDDEVKVAILNGVFRGDMSGSPATIRLINQGKWAEAAVEYLNNAEYRDAVKSKSGVAGRMERNARVLAKAQATKKSTITSAQNK